jgi:hypothetical protein
MSGILTQVRFRCHTNSRAASERKLHAASRLWDLRRFVRWENLRARRENGRIASGTFGRDPHAGTTLESGD